MAFKTGIVMKVTALLLAFAYEIKKGDFEYPV